MAKRRKAAAVHLDSGKALPDLLNDWEAMSACGNIVDRLGYATTTAERVTCKACQRTKAYRAAKKA